MSFFSFGKKKQLDSQSLFNDWVETIIKNETPNSTIIAINFGIFETGQGYKLYFAGFKSFDKDNDDWAVGLGDFKPKDNYFNLPNEEFKELAFDVAQNKVVTLIENFMKTQSYKNSFLERAIAISTGFDDGDLIKIKVSNPD
jgi:hypothetical protein